MILQHGCFSIIFIILKINLILSYRIIQIDDGQAKYFENDNGQHKNVLAEVKKTLNELKTLKQSIGTDIGKELDEIGDLIAIEHKRTKRIKKRSLNNRKAVLISRLVDHGEKPKIINFKSHNMHYRPLYRMHQDSDSYDKLRYFYKFNGNREEKSRLFNAFKKLHNYRSVNKQDQVNKAKYIDINTHHIYQLLHERNKEFEALKTNKKQELLNALRIPHKTKNKSIAGEEIATKLRNARPNSVYKILHERNMKFKPFKGKHPKNPKILIVDDDQKMDQLEKYISRLNLLRLGKFIDKSGEVYDPYAPGLHSSEESEQAEGTPKHKETELPEYSPWNYWTYQMEIVQDECPEDEVLVGGVCIWTPPH